jgi:hypothetical protein
MSVLEQVHDFIVARPREPICDKCIAERLGLSVPNHANHKTRELAKTNLFIVPKELAVHAVKVNW